MTRRRGPGGSAHRPTDGDSVTIWGLHAVAAALANPRRTVLALKASENAARRLGPLAAERGVAVTVLPPRALGAGLPPDTVHQGAVLSAAPLAPVGLAEAAPGRPLIALDQVTDPRNVGAILRVAAAFDVGGVLVTRRHRPEESGVLAKAASGGLEHVPLIEVGNLARALGAARDAGYWVVGLDSEAEAVLDPAAASGVALLVLGAEGAGLRRLTRESCEALCRLELAGPIKSLNVSVAAALALQTVAPASRR